MKPIVIDLVGRSIGPRQLIEIASSPPYQTLKNNSWTLCAAGDRVYSIARTFLMLENENPTLFCQLSDTDELAQATLHFLQERFGNSGGLCAFLTSGSTGVPKLVVHTVEDLREASRKIIQRFPEVAGKRLHHLFPENYMAGILNSSVIPIISGGTIVLDNRFDFRSSFTLLARAMEHKSEMAWLSPSMLAAMTSQALRGRSVFPPWELILAATGPLSTGARDQGIATSGIPILNTFGTTESLFISAELKPSNEVSCGIPLDGVQASIQIDELTRSQIGSGPLCIESNTTAKYIFQGLKDNEGKISYTEVVPLSLNYILTGDLSIISEQGIHIIGRTDDIVVLGGLNVSLSRVEEVARQFQHILDVCAIAPFGGSIADLILYFEIFPDVEFSERNFHQYLVSELGIESSPRRLVNISLPRTANGKVARQTLRDGFGRK